MFDTRRKGFVHIYLYFIFLSINYLISFLSRKKVKPLFDAMYELIGQPIDGPMNAYISCRQVAHLIQVLDENEHKRLSREQFINMRNTNWTDEKNGNGLLLIEHPC